MSVEELKIVRLTSLDNNLIFDCGDADLNEFLINDAVAYQKERLAVTHLLLSQKDETVDIVGYFCLLTDKLAFDPSDEVLRKIWKAFNKRNKIHFNKHRKTYPAVKIGRLAVASAMAGKGLGSLLIDSVISLVLEMKNIGCRFITVDAYENAFDFYQKNDFEFLSGNDLAESTRLMYYDMKRFNPEY